MAPAPTWPSAGPSAAATIAARYEAHPNQVSACKRQAVEGLDEVFSQAGSKRGGEHETTIRDLHAKIAS